MARKQLSGQWAEHRRQRDEEERRQRVMVITELDAGLKRSTSRRRRRSRLQAWRLLRPFSKRVSISAFAS